MEARVFTVGDETFRSIALIAVADMPLFSETSWSVRFFLFRMLLILFPTLIVSTDLPSLYAFMISPGLSPCKRLLQ
jgi:hypothetical protein